MRPTQRPVAFSIAAQGPKPLRSHCSRVRSDNSATSSGLNGVWTTMWRVTTGSVSSRVNSARSSACQGRSNSRAVFTWVMAQL